MSHAQDLTICTVSYGHRQHLVLNHDLLMCLNPMNGAAINWLVAENAPEDKPFRMVTSDSRFTHKTVTNDTSHGASHHHAMAMNDLIREVRTRYLLVLDPDFYILLPDWINQVLAHMREKGLAFFGVPWHPKHSENYRYFPAVHCMFIDLHQVTVTDLDFRPILAQEEHPPISRIGQRIFKHRWRKPWDTGTRIYNRFHNNLGRKSECVLPVFRITTDCLTKPPSTKSRLIESFLPEFLCYLPKNNNSYSETDFTLRGYSLPELPNLWEQFIWRNQPFGLHVRGSYAAFKRKSDSELSLLWKVLEIMTKPGCIN